MYTHISNFKLVGSICIYRVYNTIPLICIAIIPHYFFSHSRHQANNVRLQYFDIWIMIREHLEPTAESTAFFYVTQLVYRIFEMLPKDVQRQIVAIKRKHAEWMNVYLSFGYYSEVQDVEVDAMELFLKYQARNLKQWMAWLNDPNQWRHKYIDYTWVSDVWRFCCPFSHCIPSN